MVTLDEAYKRKLSIEDVDALTGTIIGRPKSATFRTADIVGLDTMQFVAKTAYDKCVDDESRETFQLPDYIQKMIDNNWLGQKSGQGFYKRIEKGEIFSEENLTVKRPGTGGFSAEEFPNILGKRALRDIDIDMHLDN